MNNYFKGEQLASLFLSVEEQVKAELKQQPNLAHFAPSRGQYLGAEFKKLHLLIIDTEKLKQYGNKTILKINVYFEGNINMLTYIENTNIDVLTNCNVNVNDNIIVFEREVQEEDKEEMATEMKKALSIVKNRIDENNQIIFRYANNFEFTYERIAQGLKK